MAEEIDLITQDVLQMVAFRLLDETYAVNISYVQEIIRPQEITDVPHTDAHIRGVINLRGQIIPVIDLKIKFGLKSKEQTSMSRIMVVNVDGTIVGIVVDAVSEVLRLEPDSIEPPSPVISNLNADFIKGVGKYGDQMIIILDIEKILVTRGRVEGIPLEAGSYQATKG